MKVLNISMGAPFTEGYSYQDNLLSEYQHKLGHEVTVVTSTKCRNRIGQIVETSPCLKTMDNGVRLIRIPCGGKIRQFLGVYPGLKRIIQQEEPNMIYMHGLGSFVVGQAICYKKRHPQVYIVADNHQDEGTTKTEGFPFSLMLRFWKFCWTRWIGSVAQVFGTTSWRGEFAEKYYGIPHDKVQTLIMGVDTDRLPTDVKNIRIQVRNELNIPEDAVVFVSGGKLDARKSTLEMVRAFMSAPDSNSMLILFGSIAEDIHDEFIECCNTDKRIIYLGYIESTSVCRYFFASDFGLFPGRHSVLWEEAIGCGLPCLFRKYSENDHVQVCDNCIQIDTPITVEKIERQIERVIHEPGLLAELKANSEKAAKEFSYYTIAEKSIRR